MKVIPCGTDAVLKIGNIEGMITAVIIRFDRVQYEFTYFFNGEQRSLWTTEHELKMDSQTKNQQIGFTK